MVGPGARVLIDLAEGLFHIALANGELHEAEEIFLRHVIEIFGLSETCYRTLRARFVENDPHDPYDILGVRPDMPMEEIRKAWKQAVRESHPDGMAARGLPEEAIRLAQNRLRDINRAWEIISSKVAA